MKVENPYFELVLAVDGEVRPRMIADNSLHRLRIGREP